MAGLAHTVNTLHQSQDAVDEGGLDVSVETDYFITPQTRQYTNSSQKPHGRPTSDPRPRDATRLFNSMTMIIYYSALPRHHGLSSATNGPSTNAAADGSSAHTVSSSSLPIPSTERLELPPAGIQAESSVGVGPGAFSIRGWPVTP